MDIKTYLADKRAKVDEALKRYMPGPHGHAGKLIEAMNYSLFAGGKRLRPILCISGAEAVGGDAEKVLPAACALEMIHTYSLIHDDLPAMDNDDLRRGKPTSHKTFGEAIAILAGDGLLTEAFAILARLELSGTGAADVIKKIIGLIATASGWQGMVGGQAMDILSEGKDIDSSIMGYIHSHKTGALITASVTSGAILGGCSQEHLNDITIYGQKIGLAFQIADDILDIEGNAEEMGKGTGGDSKKGKNTFPSVYGLNESKKILSESIDYAIEALGRFDTRADPLRHIARYISERKK
ncbi:MAG: polyprenyl synthetase family protein [Deltaproteobacteria bacterium]|nr:polyprenyl synthetase family protein [Deltaproteobacteria bacterium]